MSSADLTPNSLYIALFVRTTLEENNFHWTLYLHVNQDDGGVKFNVRGLGSAGGWITDHGPTKDITKSFLMVVLVRIATVPARLVAGVGPIIQDDDNRLNEVQGITCRVWTLRACERLKVAGVLDFESPETLQNEMFAFGNRFNKKAEDNVQPRPIAVSQACRAVTNEVSTKCFFWKGYTER